MRGGTTLLLDETGYSAPTFQLPGPGGTAEHPEATASRVAARFDLPSPLETHDFPEKGNINQHTYLVTSGTGVKQTDYLLQQINQQVFTRPDKVMASMISCIECQQESMAVLKEPLEWETITLIPTREGEKYLKMENRRGRSFWRIMKRIPGCRTFKSLGELGSRPEQLQLAEEAGRGLALYCDLTAEMDITGLENPLPGYRDTRVYFNQLKSVQSFCRTLDEASAYLPEDPVVRQSTEQHYLVHLSQEEYDKRQSGEAVQRFVNLALDSEEFGLTLLNLMDTGEIRTVAIHGDTKLDNFLFSTRTGKAKALIDLDTIMPHTWLADWGDMARSLTNLAGEKEKDLSTVEVDMEVYEALARGFLQTANRVTEREVDLMCEAVQIISLELGIRFLTDYLRGDSYFKLSATDPPDLNRTRGMVQLTLFEQLKKNAAETRACIERWRGH